MSARILVTGGSGFIGTNLVQHLTEHGEDVLNLDIVAPRNSAQKGYWQRCDLCDLTTVCNLVRDFSPEVVFHMGARTDLDGRSISEYVANTVGVKNLIVAVSGSTFLRRIVFASSRLVCRIGYLPVDEFDYCPVNYYGESKVLGENIVRDSLSRLPCPALIVRPTSIWGPWFDVPYKSFFLSIAHGRYVHPGTAKILKSFGFVGNTIHELCQLVKAPAEAIAGKTVYLADYPPIEVAEMANAIQRAWRVKSIKTVSTSLLRPVAWAGDCLKTLGWSNPPLTSFRLENLLTTMVHDLEPLKEVVGTLPFSMDDGVRITVDWLRSQGEVS